MKEALSVSGLALRREGRVVLAEAGFALEEGEIAALQGRSGSGKTTLLRLIAGLEAPDAGEILLDGRPASRAGRVLLPPRERGLGYVPQGHSLWPHLDAFENAAFPLRVRGIASAEVASRVGELLASLGVAALAKRPPAELSGGEQQRVALARALVHRPRLVLLDEPLTGLDAETRAESRRVLRASLERSGAAALFVTHDAEEARAVAGRLLRLSDGRVSG